jgi:hypothetical protein
MLKLNVTLSTLVALVLSASGQFLSAAELSVPQQTAIFGGG